MFFDVHAHVYKYPYLTPGGFELFLTPEERVVREKELGIHRSVLLPIVSSETYMPQSVGEVIELAERSDGKWIPFCNIDPRVYSNSSDAPIGMLLEFYQNKGCKGIGEVLPNLQLIDPRFQNLLKCVERIGMPLLFDITGSLNRGYGIYDDPGLPQLEYCLEKYPNLHFIGHGPAFWAEIGTLRNPADRFTYPSYEIDDEGRVPYLLRTYPNLWFDLSAGSGLNALKRDSDYAVTFLHEFSDRGMYGTDLCYRDQPSPIGDLLVDLRDTGKLGNKEFDAIACGNITRLLGV
ncbi:MAG: hypothetical protein GXY52_00345 [Chloroflexi bacterium]|nr:hypothetical protein [Chloroflexota bacterium]